MIYWWYEDVFICDREETKMKNYRTGLVSVSFRRNTPSEIILAAKDAGLSYIEWGSDAHAPYQERDALHKIRELQEKQGIACSSYGTYTPSSAAGP